MAVFLDNVVPKLVICLVRIGFHHQTIVGYIEVVEFGLHRSRRQIIQSFVAVRERIPGFERKIEKKNGFEPNAEEPKLISYPNLAKLVHNFVIMPMVFRSTESG